MMADTKQVQEEDALVRAAVNFLTELLPAAHLPVSYRLESDVGEISTSREFHLDPANTWRFSDCRQVPSYPEYHRIIEIRLKEQLGIFLGRSAHEHLEEVSGNLRIPLEVAHQWTRDLQEVKNSESQEALQAELPIYIIAHELADHYARFADEERYSFEHYRTDSPHDTLASTIVRSLDYMKDLASAQVEHQRISHGLLIAPHPSGAVEPGRYPDDLKKMQRTPLLTDGFRSLLWILPDGRPVKMLTRHMFNQQFGVLPRQFGALSFATSASRSHEGIGIVLRPEGSIVTFVGGEPLFISRGGSWAGLLWNAIRSVMAERWGQVGRLVFDAALILATEGEGGILCIADRLSQQLSEKDRVDLARTADRSRDGSTYPEWMFHNMLPGENVLEMGEDALAMLASIDGATVVEPTGNLITYGAIVPSELSGEEGARATAARALSKNGFVIKVSEDGPIELFENEEAILEL